MNKGLAVIAKRIFYPYIACMLICTWGCHGIGSQDSFQSIFSSQAPASSVGGTHRMTAPEVNIFSVPSSNKLTAITAAHQTTVSEPVVGLPIDFPTVLRLAGEDNWNVKIARQRVNEASAKYCAAKNEWLPSISFGLGFNKHEGELQSTEGDVLSVSRNSLFLGGGLGIQNTPLNGGSGGPSRLTVDFSFAEAIFKPLAASRLLGAEQARRSRVINDTLLKASLAYYELVRAQSQLAVAQANLTDAQEVARLTQSFVEGGKGTAADTSRISVIVDRRRQQQVTAIAEIKIASSRLATILQLDPTKLDPETGLIALDSDPIPVDLVSPQFDLNSAIAQAQNLRCEIAEANAISHAARSEMLAEQWRPWLPNLYMGYSGGVFGGGQGGDLPNLDGRSDLDLVVTWQVKNLGFGTRANQDASRSRLHQRKFEMKQLKDMVAEQVTTAHQRVLQFQSMTEILNQSVNNAGSGLENNLTAIRGLKGLPLEAISSLDQLAQSRRDYVNAVINYNQWQVRLLRAAGQSLAADAEIGTVASCNAHGCDVCLPTCSACFKKPARRSCRSCSTTGGCRADRLQSSNPSCSQCSPCQYSSAGSSLQNIGTSYLNQTLITPKLTLSATLPVTWHRSEVIKPEPAPK